MILRVLTVLGVAACGLGIAPCDEDGGDSELEELPPVCPAVASRQSPARFGPEAITPEVAQTCETSGTDWRPCHQHMHCGPEHSGAGICGSAECEVHTVYRKRKDGGATEAVESLHEGSVAGNCAPADHDLMVVATFLSFEAGCTAGPASALTYCGSATGNNTADTDSDGAVTCTEAGVNATSVRWCIETQCECKPGGSAEEETETFGEIEATKVQGCPGS